MHKMRQIRVDFTRERAWWDAKAAQEDEAGGDTTINRALRWREVERNLTGVRTILDVGAGTGAYSIPLARRGFQVTHLDFSPRMLEMARSRAKGIRRIVFVEANAADLTGFRNRSFDLVLNMDGAISFCGSAAGNAVRESCRVARKRVIVAVSNRAMLASVAISTSLQASGRFMRAVEPIFRSGSWHQDQFPENIKFSKGTTQDYFGALKAFLPGELKVLLEKNGMHVRRCGGLGSLAWLCGKETAERVKGNRQLFNRFVDWCDRFDREIMPDGPGTRLRAGLIAVAEPRTHPRCD